MKILAINGIANDPTLPLVRRALRRRGCTLHHLSTIRFPPPGLTMRPGERDGRIATAGAPIALQDVSAVWYRGDWDDFPAPDGMPREVRQLCVEAARVSVDGLRSALDVLWVDDPFQVRLAENKPMQLAIARDVGLSVPRTVVTNRAADVRRFAATCGGEVVTKMVTRSGFLGKKRGRVYTRLLSATDLDDLSGLEQSPMMFQERIPKALELRVTVVGRELFGASVESQVGRRSRVDWRRDQASIAHTWKRCELPADLREGLMALIDRLGLHFAGVDLIVTPEGRYVFLELNPDGDFAFVEPLFDFAISEALADLLSTGGARCHNVARIGGDPGEIAAR